jgi:hypothetical protein
MDLTQEETLERNGWQRSASSTILLQYRQVVTIKTPMDGQILIMVLFRR